MRGSGRALTPCLVPMQGFVLPQTLKVLVLFQNALTGTIPADWQLPGARSAGASKALPLRLPPTNTLQLLQPCACRAVAAPTHCGMQHQACLLPWPWTQGPYSTCTSTTTC